MISNRRVGERERVIIIDIIYVYTRIFKYFFFATALAVFGDKRGRRIMTRRVRPASRVRGEIRILWGSAETPVTEKYNNIYACT
jgi:hypothetical protein